MFTGIVEEKGVIRRIDIHGKSGSILISAKKVLKGTILGDSIAVNGICLTVTSMGEDFFTADVMAETVRRSSLSSLKPGSKVNLERAMSANGRFGGHIVSGHIDGVGTIISFAREENAIWIEIEASSEILKYIVCKGSICIDGISLTVAEVTGCSFKVSVIPHTASETTLLEKRSGDLVNLENDVIAKYIEKFLNLNSESKSKSSLSMEMLSEYGY